MPKGTLSAESTNTSWATSPVPKAQMGGEFFTPKSLVKLIVEIIEPYHGRIFDPACGSGGMVRPKCCLH